jgi:hypothetical protein
MNANGIFSTHSSTWNKEIEDTAPFVCGLHCDQPPVHVRTEGTRVSRAHAFRCGGPCFAIRDFKHQLLALLRHLHHKLAYYLVDPSFPPLTNPCERHCSRELPHGLILTSASNF